jgi:hypothetical protein
MAAPVPEIMDTISKFSAFRLCMNFIWVYLHFSVLSIGYVEIAIGKFQ